MSKESTLREQAIIIEILKQFLTSDNFNLSNKKRSEIVKKLFTLKELQELPEPIGEAYYFAYESIQPIVYGIAKL